MHWRDGYGIFFDDGTDLSRLGLIGAIALGGMVGALARYGLSFPAAALLPHWPFAGTLAANASGSLLVGAVAAWAVRRSPSVILEGFLVTGFCGGFTTFSLFSLEMMQLLTQGSWRMAGAYGLGSILSWIGAVWVGWSLAMALFPQREKSHPDHV